MVWRRINTQQTEAVAAIRMGDEKDGHPCPRGFQQQRLQQQRLQAGPRPSPCFLSTISDLLD